MLLYLIRHGDPDYANDTLTEKGRLQAEALAKRLSLHGLDRLYVSPLGRAKATAAPTEAALGMQAEEIDWLSENYGFSIASEPDGEGHRRWMFHRQPSDCKTEENMVFLPHGDEDPPVFAGTGITAKLGEFATRADPFFEGLGYRREGAIYRILTPSEERVALFCHQGLGLTLLCHLLAIPPQIFYSTFDIAHSSVSILHFCNYENGFTAPKCIQLSDLSHLYGEGLPYQYSNAIEL